MPVTLYKTNSVVDRLALGMLLKIYRRSRKNFTGNPAIVPDKIDNSIENRPERTW